MHQSVPAVPITPPGIWQPGICSRLNPTGGAFEILLLPTAYCFYYLPTPGQAPSIWNPCGFGLAGGGDCSLIYFTAC